MKITFSNQILGHITKGSAGGEQGRYTRQTENGIPRLCPAQNKLHSLFQHTQIFLCAVNAKLYTQFEASKTPLSSYSGIVYRSGYMGDVVQVGGCGAWWLQG